MIYVTIERLAPDSPQISSFVVEGHAEYDVPGKDLVCAAVSAVTVGTYNSIESLNGRDSHSRDGTRLDGCYNSRKHTICSGDME